MSRGLFIAFEGGDGAGKSTQLEALRQRLEQWGRKVLTTREPGGTPLGAQIRQLLLHGEDGSVSPRAEALLFAADRAHHVDSKIIPALESGIDVITDRYVDSTFAYQGAGRVLDVAELEPLTWWAASGLKPDLTVILDLDPAVGRARRDGIHDRMEREADEFHERVRRGFLHRASLDQDRYLVLDASTAPEELSSAVWARVGELVHPLSRARPT